MPGHRIGANREMARSAKLGGGEDWPAPRKVDAPRLVLSIASYAGAICVIGWLVFTFVGASGDAGTDAPQLVSSPEPAPTVAPTVAAPSYVEARDDFAVGDGAQTDEYWTSGPNPAIPPSQDPLTRQQY